MVGTRLEGKVAIVTGAASGFGKAIARRYAEEGARVVLTDLNGDGVEKVTKELGVGDNAISMAMDVSQEQPWKDVAKLALDKWGKIDILVNNAGTSYPNKPTLEVTGAEWERVFNVNVRSIFWSVHAVVPQMKKQGGGSIINISSTGSIRPRGGLVWYNSSKGAVTNATLGLADEFGKDGVRINAIAPLLSGTGLFSTFVGVEDTPENRKKFTSNVPMGRLSEPEDIANAALFLGSDESQFITGLNMQVDGGKCIA